MIDFFNSDIIEKKRKFCLRNASIWAEMVAMKYGYKNGDRYEFIRRHVNRTRLEVDNIIFKIRSGTYSRSHYLNEFKSYCKEVKFQLKKMMQETKKAEKDRNSL